MSKFRPPEALTFDDQHSLADQWRMWAQEMRLYLELAMAKNTEKEKCTAFLYIIGRKGREIFNTWTLTETEKDKISILFERFQSYCEPKKNLTLERYRFNTRTQSENETLDEFITELTKLAKRCQYGTLEEEMIRDRLVCGIKKPIVKERLLREAELNLSQAVTICRADEESNKGLTMMKQEEVHAIGLKKKFDKKDYQTKRKDDQVKIQKCKKCGRSHPPRQCPAYGKTCLKCKKLNHFANMCKSKMVKEVAEDENSDKSFYIGSVEVNSVDTNKVWLVELDVRGHQIRAKIDTGAQVNVISQKLVNKLGTQITHSDTKLTAYSGDSIPVVGQTNLKCFYKGKEYLINFIVTSYPSATTILGLKTSEKMNLFKRINTVKESKNHNFDMTSLIKEYSDTFGALGCLEEAHHIEIDPHVEPIVSPPRRVPLGQRKKLEQKLREMITQKVIVKVDEPTDWVNPMILVNKPNGDIRICMDPQRLNTAIKREHFQLPTMEELTMEMKGAQYFTKLDASSGFWQIPLDESSSKLCTFATPFGRFRFCRLPFGIKSAPEVFQKSIQRHFGDLPGVVNFEDDLCIWSRSIEEHTERLRKVFERARKCGIKFNRSKCKFAQTSLPYLGHILTQEGIKVDEEKVSAISNMPTPTNKQELMRFLGMVTYLTKFIPDMSMKTAPLRKLLEKDTEWLWLHTHDNAVSQLKEILSKAPVLSYFDVNKPVTVMADASKDGLGAAILQDNKPVAYASRSLTPAEKHYAVIEKETLAVVFAMERFHQYIYGKHVTVESDHKPLVSIQYKTFNNCPARIQRFLLRLQKYDFTIKYVKGKDQVLADTLSRAVETDNMKPIKTEIPEEEIHEMVAQIINEIPASDSKREEIKKKQLADEECQALRKLSKFGWPDSIKATPTLAKPYWSFREEIVENNGLLLKSTQIIIPKDMRADMLRRIHGGHLGIELSRQRARQAVYWPNMNKQIEELVQKCSTCQKHRNTQQKETLISHDIPSHVFEKVGADLFTLDNKDYLLIVDYTSKYFEICLLQTNTTSQTVINHMKSVFARHGIPRILFTDNGPQFTANSFKTFTTDWEIQHITSSPLYPQSNGQVERTVQTVKNLLKKARDSHEDPYLSILNFRTTNKQNQKSPAEMLMGRKLRTLLPAFVEKEERSNKQSNQEKYYNLHAKDMEELEVGDNVRFRDNNSKTWEPAQIKQKLSNRSYIIKTNQGVYRRNRRSLMKTQEHFDLKPESIDMPIFQSFPSEDYSTPSKVTGSGEVTPTQSQVQGGSPTTPAPTQTSSIPHTPAMHYTTKFGRVVKPNPKYKD